MKKVIVTLVMLVCVCFGKTYAFQNAYDIFKYKTTDIIINSNNWQIETANHGSVRVEASKLILTDNDATGTNGISVKRTFPEQSGKVYAEVSFNCSSIIGLKIQLSNNNQTAACFTIDKEGYMHFANAEDDTVKLINNSDYILRMSCDFLNNKVDYYLTNSNFTGENFTEYTESYTLLEQPFMNNINGVNEISFKTLENTGACRIGSIGVTEIANPPQAHPRLFTNSAEVDTLKSKISTLASVEYKLYKKIKDESDLYSTSDITAAYNKNIRKTIEACACRYLIDKDSYYGQKAIDMVTRVLNETTSWGSSYGETYYRGDVIVTASIVYDWCYELFNTPGIKEDYIDMLESQLNLQELGYHAVGSPISGHSSGPLFLRNVLAAAIAMYGDKNEAYDVSAGKLFREYIDFRNFSSPSGFHHMGLDYMDGRYTAEMYANIMFLKMGHKDIFAETQSKIPYSILYARRPDGQLLRDGDTYSDTLPLGNYWDRSLSMGLASAYYGEPFIQSEFISRQKFNTGVETLSNSLSLILFNFSDSGLSSSKLPNTRFFSAPHASMIARTGWDENSAIVYMKMGGYQLNNHQHLDVGQFQIYYKGALSIDSGVYEGLNGSYFDDHDKNYGKRTIAHNCMLVYNPNESFKSGTVANDGGQRWVSNASEPDFFEDILYGDRKVSEVLAHELGSDQTNPEYSYIKGDLTKAYNNNKVSDYKRSMFFLNFNNENRPGALIVFDKVKSVDSSFKKYWLLHSINQPQTNGNTTTIVNGQGKITNTALLPESKSIVSVGGSEHRFDVFGVNYNGTLSGGPSTCDETGNWRIQISPNTNRTDNLFLNVMEICDNNLSPLEAKKIETTEFAGAKINNNIILFSKSGQKIDTAFELNGTPSYYYITDLIMGTWKLYKDDIFVGDINVTEEGGVARFLLTENGVIRMAPPAAAADLLPVTDIRTSALTSNQAYLTWKPSNYDNVTYEIYADNQLKGSTKDTVYMLKELDGANSYNVKIKAVATNAYADSDIMKLNTPARPPAGISVKRFDGEVLIKWNEESAADSYDVLIDGEIYSNAASPYYYKYSSIKEHEIKVRSVLNGIAGEWSEGAFLNSFVDNFDNRASNSSWSFETLDNSSVSFGNTAAGNEACLLLTDNDYDTNNEYRTAVRAKRKLNPTSGKVVLETRFMFNKVNHLNNNMDFSIYGKDANGINKQVVSILTYSNGALGYANSSNSSSYRYIPGTDPYKPLTANTWVNVKIIMNTVTNSYDLIVRSDLYKGYTGTPNGNLDTINGIYKVTNIPFYNSNKIYELSEFEVGLNRYTGKYYFDYFKLYELNSDENRIFADDFTYGEIDDAWVINNSLANCGVSLGKDSVENKMCMVFTDNDYDTNNQYRTAVSADRKFDLTDGKLVFETKFLFSRISHLNSNMNFIIYGRNEAGTDIYSVKLLTFSNGSFGYADYNAGTGYHYLPGTPELALPEKTWVYVMIVLDTNTQTYDLVVRSDMYKGYSGIPSGNFDSVNGIYSVTGLPFYSPESSEPFTPAFITKFSKIRISLDKYTGAYYFDYFKLNRYDNSNLQFISNKTLKNSNGEDITDYSKDEHLFLTADVENRGNTESDDLIYCVAEYENGRLIQIKSKIGRIPRYGKDTLNLDLNVSGNKSLFKSFIWHYQSMNPLDFNNIE